MKKNLLTIAAVAVLGMTGFAQEFANRALPKTLPNTEFKQDNKITSNADQKRTSSPSTASITDTVDYYGNKFYFLTPPSATSYPLTSYEFLGGKDLANLKYSYTRFINGVPLNINTAGVKLFKVSANPVNVTYSICALNASGYPVFPALATATAVVTNTAISTVWADFSPAVSLTSNFAIVAGLTSGAPFPSNPDSVGIALYRAASIPTNTTGVTSWTCTPYNFFDTNCLLTIPTSTVNYTTQYSAYDKYQWEMKFGISTTATAAYSLTASSASCSPVTYTYSNISPSIFGSGSFNFNRFVANFSTSLVSCIDGTPFNSTNFPYESVYSFNPGNGSPVLTASTSAVAYSATYNTGAQANYLSARYRTSWAGRLITDVAAKQFTVDACTGINELTSNNFVVYPNPSNGIVSIKNLANNSTLELYNVLGELLFKEKVSGDFTTLDFSKFASANYYLKVTIANGQSNVQKLHFN
jgi:hypothetical protein